MKELIKARDNNYDNDAHDDVNKHETRLRNTLTLYEKVLLEDKEWKVDSFEFMHAFVSLLNSTNVSADVTSSVPLIILFRICS